VGCIMATSSPWTFERYGRSCHFQIRSADDLARAAELDEAHWVATNAPIATINADATFLQLLDTDHNGRIMCHEVRGAIRWLGRVLRDHAGVGASSRTLRPEAINVEDPEGRRAHQAVEKMLRRLGRPEAGEISLDEIRRIKTQVESTPVSEAGVVLPQAAEDESVRGFLADVIATVGGAPHPGGAQGVGQAQLEAFLAQASALLEWMQRGQIPPGQERTEVMPLGGCTPEAFAAFSAVRAKLDQYFAQCEAAAVDERFVQRMGWTDQELQGLDFDDPAVIEKVLRQSPLAKVRADRTLQFGQPVNPYYAEALERFRGEVVRPVLGQDPSALSAGAWVRIKAFFAAHQAWVQSKPQSAVESLGAEKLREYLSPRYAEAVRALIAESAQTAFDMDNIRLVEKLALYQAYLIDLANNFISFPHLYDTASRAMFERGSLVMDGRRFNLAVLVENRAAHSAVAKTSNMFLLYVEVAPRDGKSKYEVAVPVTSGGRGNLCVGKRGVFREVSGAEGDARVVDIIDNPISLREALVAPFIRLGRLLGGKIESLTAQAEKKLDTRAAAAVDKTVSGAVAGPAAPAQSSRLAAGGMLMGAGVAVAALGSALAYIAKTVSERPLGTVIGLGIAIALVLVPTSIVAFLRLRRRDLSAILEGSGWGINARMRLTRKQGRFFTQRPPYPRGSRGVRPFPWWRMAGILLILAAVAGGVCLVRRALSKPKPPPPAGPAASAPAPRP